MKFEALDYGKILTRKAKGMPIKSQNRISQREGESINTFD